MFERNSSYSNTSKISVNYYNAWSVDGGLSTRAYNGQISVKTQKDLGLNLTG